MADSPISAVAGLQVSNNTFSNSPPGSLQRADNCVMPQAGVIEPRRGQDRAYVAPTAQEIPLAQAEFRGSLIINSAPDKYDDYTLGIAANPTVDFDTGPWNPVDSTPDDAAPQMKFGFSGSYMHFCTTTGPKTLETLADDPRSAGLQRMPDVLPLAQSNTQPGAWLPYGSAVAYRTVLRKPTDDGTSLLSPPSGRAVYSNRIVARVGQMQRSAGTTVTVTFGGAADNGLGAGDVFTLDPGEADFAAGPYTVATNPSTNVITYASVGANVTNSAEQDFDVGTRAVGLTALLSDDATIATPVRFYRSVATAATNVDPSDEMFLIAEVFPDAGDITAGTLTIDDTTPDSVISDPLYTNPQTGGGIDSANCAPPLYRDTTNWAERQWYAQTTNHQTFNLQMLGVGSPDGVQANDTLTIFVPEATSTPYVFTFKTNPLAAGDVQLVSDTGIPSVNIQQTAQYLVTAINLAMDDDDTPVRAYYNSAQDESPGKILIQRTDLVQDNITDDGAFALAASRPLSWTPALLDTAVEADATFSADEYQPNGLAYSKPGQAESVPLLNYTAVGSKNYPIARIIGLQNALLVFKQGDGIYSVTGNFPFQVLQISTANIIAPDACSKFADNAWAYTDQGFLRVTDAGGNVVVSRQIETELNRLRAELPDETRDYAFTVPYETERRIMLFVPFSGDDTTAPPTLVLKAWCYNNATQVWSGPLDYGQPFSGTVGLIANRLTLGVWDDVWSKGRVTSERKGTGYLDYADAGISKTILAVGAAPTSTLFQLSDDTDVEVGDGFSQGDWKSKILAVRTDLGARWFELYEELPLEVLGACTIFKHYDVALQFLPNGAPSSRKTLSRLQLIFKPEWFANYAGKTLIFTDQMQADDEIDTPSLGFGLMPFGEGPFGNPSPLSVDVNPIKPAWATAAQFFPGFSLSEAWPKLRLQGVGLYIDNASGPAGRGRG